MKLKIKTDNDILMFISAILIVLFWGLFVAFILVSPAIIILVFIKLLFL